METKNKIIFLVMGVFLISLVCAAPPIPNHFMGNASIDGTDAPIGTEIKVYVAGNETIYNTIQLGKYDLYVKTGNIDDNIEFKILDKLAGSSNRTNGETIILNLEVSQDSNPVSPPQSSESPSGGGGGGGGSSTYWKCVQWNDWSECSDGEQTRTCTEKVKCSFSEKTDLSETKNCALDSVETEDDNVKLESDEIQETTGSGITGAVIGFAKTGKGIGLIFGFIIIVFGIGVMAIRKKSLKNE